MYFNEDGKETIYKRTLNARIYLVIAHCFYRVFICIVVFLILYQKAIIQNMAEDVTQSLSRQWGYKPLPVDEINSGVYKRETYESRKYTGI